MSRAVQRETPSSAPLSRILRYQVDALQVSEKQSSGKHPTPPVQKIVLHQYNKHEHVKSLATFFFKNNAYYKIKKDSDVDK